MAVSPVADSATVNTLAPKGKAGDWLLDPATITVATGGAATLTAAADGTDTTSNITIAPATINAGIQRIERLYGQADVIENETTPVPGTQNTFDLRAQNPHGPFGAPLLSLVCGQYPAGANEIAVTGGVATDFHLQTGSSWTVAGRTYQATIDWGDGSAPTVEALTASFPWDASTVPIVATIDGTHAYAQDGGGSHKNDAAR